jgi:hypothetical protein
VSRGGRRRRTKGGGRAAEESNRQPQRRAGEPHSGRELETAGPAQKRTQPAAIQSEPAVVKHQPVRTLPPDGLILEEIISTMRSEYGVPTTPQEYRLLLKTAIVEDVVETPVPEPRPARQEVSNATAPRPARRRRRGRRPQVPGGSQGSGEGS